MNRTLAFAARVIGFCLLSTFAVGDVAADILPPETAAAATSPNGVMLVRLRDGYVHRYEHDRKTESYKLARRFKLKQPHPQFVFVSNSGDVVAILLSRHAIDVYDTDGIWKQGWRLNEFLSTDQFEGCLRTASTTQWFEEAKFQGRLFGFRGPSPRVRRLPHSHIVMHAAKTATPFEFLIDCETGVLTEVSDKEEPVSPERIAPRAISRDPSYRSYDGQPIPEPK